MTFGTHRFCVAPMMDWTDRHDRYFLRLLSRHARLYTEMIPTGALLHGDRERFLRFDASEHPVALQLGGAEPEALAQCAEFGEAAGYDEVNVNCGCPSDRVQEAEFGACLMLDPHRVARAVKAMRAAVRVPVTVKCRIGVDDSEEYPFLRTFIGTVADAGCELFIIHARKAWLSGLSPAENREIPPLQYATVYRLKRDFPHLKIIINGGIRTLAECTEHLRHVDGVMLGREVYENPWLLTEADARLFGATPRFTSRADVVYALKPYVERELASGTLLNHMTRHILGLFRSQPGGRAFRRVLSQQAHVRGADFRVLAAALAAMESNVPAQEAVAS
ncbi:MAG TPA: tRNA dihydrouridine(20/20a) synthase DusA [Verrucomicrobiae bacterium]|nr:tRNA dihydrouridine(20/20a) synthase DusA [Verrucomicrobiae bacterium]